MSRFKSKNILHLIVLFALFLLIIVLITMPGNVAGAPPYRIEYKGKKPPLSQIQPRRIDSRELEAQRHIEEAKREQERAYIPRGEPYRSTQEIDRAWADSNLRAAEQDLQRIQSDRYLEQRIQESNQREAQIRAERERQREVFKKKRVEPPPRAKK